MRWPPISKPAWIKAAHPGAGLDAPAMHRLNRTEYANAVRDLLALDVDVAVLLPPDASSDGFDNIADALERVAVAHPGLRHRGHEDQPARHRRPDADADAGHLSAPGGLAQDRHIEGLPLGTRGGMLVKHTFPLDAEYEFSVSGGLGLGGQGGAAVDVTLDGEKIVTTTPRSFRVNVTAGPHTIGAALVDQGAIGRRGRGVLGLPRQFRVHARRRHPDGRHHGAVSRPRARATRRAVAAS